MIPPLLAGRAEPRRVRLFLSEDYGFGTAMAGRRRDWLGLTGHGPAERRNLQEVGG